MWADARRGTGLSSLPSQVSSSWRCERSPRMVGGLVAAVMLAVVGLACAHPDTDDLHDLGLSVVAKRDLEFNQYVPGYRLRGEPSCEELREMWRLSKREARRATSTNQLPRTRSYNNYGRHRTFGPDSNGRSKSSIYGSIIPYPSPSQARPSPFENLRAILGSGNRQGKYDAVHRKLTAMRGPGRSSKGRYDELRRMMAAERQEPRPVALALRASPQEAHQPSPKSRREPPAMYPRTMAGSTHFSHQGFVGPLLPADSRLTAFTPWQPAASAPDMRSCGEVRRLHCRIDSDCACAGLYRCNKARCKVSTKQPVVEDSMGGWYSGPVEQQELGVWSLR
ncbi:uncharacterized protein [Procambarus clarkii]|uniref:uncharacterized protein isoform X1 n=2 Tax=Procambarus clarkii TaxID=6728 RepID=UPI00374229F4